MQLKNHLNFLGDRNKQEITFHLSGAFNKNVVVGVDDFDKVWSYLVLLSKQHTEADILQWKENYHVTDAELCGIHSFLVTQGMVYLSDSSVKNIRLANFMGNWVSSTTYGDLNSIMSSKHVVILGAGTVGSSLIDYLLQFDVQNFTIIDGDTVMAKNIPHQRNYVPTEIGMYKCDIAKEHILQVNPNCHVDIYKQFLNTTDEFLSCICNSSVDAIFWAIDQYDSNLLGGIYDWSTASNVPIYLSGYSLGGYVCGQRLSPEFVQNLKDFQNHSQYIICENSGIGILGDLSAMFMIRLWLQDLDPRFDDGIDRLDYNFCHPTLLKQSNFTLDISAFFSQRPQEFPNNWIKENIIFPYYLMAYTEQQINGKVNTNLSDVANRFNIEPDDQPTQLENRYHSILIQKNLTKEGNSSLSLLEASQKIMATSHPSAEDFSSYNALVSVVGAVALDCLSIKKAHFLSEYNLQWNTGKDAKAMLLQISNHFYNELSADQEILACCASAQFDFELTDYDKLALVKEIDQQQAYLDFHGFIDYLELHQLLHFSKSISNGLCVLNPRYGTSDVIVQKGLPASGVFLLAHEIGHAYYNSYLPRNAEMGNSLFSEICALLTEFQMMRHLEFSNQASTWRKILLTRLSTIFLGMFFLDIFEESILSATEPDLNHILELKVAAKETVSGQSNPLSSINSLPYDFLLDTELFASKRNVYQYPEAAAFAIDLGFRMESDPELQKEFCDYISSVSTNHSLSIFEFYRHIGVEISSTFYTDVANSVNRWLSSLTYAWRGQ